MRSRAAGLLLGVLADAAFGDPRRGHPVAGFGTVAAALERRVYADGRLAGVGYTVVLVGGAAGLGAVAEARPITVLAFGRCHAAVARREWLHAAEVTPTSLRVFRSEDPMLAKSPL